MQSKEKDLVMDDAQILIGLKAGDKKAWNLLYDLLYKKVYLVTYAIVNEMMEAEDIAISALAKFWAKGPKHFETFKQAESFIFRTARNAAYDYCKKNKVQRSREEDLAYLSAKEESFIKNPGEPALFEAEMLRVLTEEIEKLPEQCKKIFKLVRIEKMPVPLVAEKLNISPSTVRVQCGIARKKLQQIFTEKELVILLLLMALCPN